MRCNVRTTVDCKRCVDEHIYSLADHPDVQGQHPHICLTPYCLTRETVLDYLLSQLLSLCHECVCVTRDTWVSGGSDTLHMPPGGV